MTNDRRPTACHRHSSFVVRRSSSSRPLVLSLALFLLTAGCSTRFLNGRLEKRIASRLRSLIGPANHYHVSIHETRDAELVLGNIRRLRVDAENVLAGGELLLDRLQLEARGIR